jgi:hypothetical protein
MAFQTTKGALRRRPEAPVEALPGAEGTRTRILSNAVVARNNAEGYANEIGKLWSEAQQKFLAIGRYLILAKEKLAHGEFERMVSTMLPFGRNVAHRLRVIAGAVDQGRLPEEALPRSYTVAYGLVILSEHEFEEARRRNLLRSTLTNRELDEFRREIRQPVGEERHAHLLRERDRLTAEVEKLRDRIEEIERELADPVTIDGHTEEQAA